ncbi:MAG TPA: aldo/keto reductase [Chloroflexota bacterium]|nr:aldo/keto reductase [Chloroflexota bacterium]
MRYRELGTTGITVSEIGFGLWTVATRMWGITDESVGLRLVAEAFDLGITLFDSADTYGNGAADRMLARALAGTRDRVVIATKFGYDYYTYGDKRVGQQEIPHDFSPAFVRRALEDSLARLQTDYIDIYQLHNPRLTHLQQDDLFALLDDCVAEGKIRAYGVALGPKIGWRDEGMYALRERRVKVLHMIYNMIEQEPGRDLAAVAREIGTGILVRVPHSSGLLEGKYTADTTFDASDHRSFRTREWLTEGLKKLEQLRFLTEGQDRTIGQAALKWLLADPVIGSALPNIYTSEQLVEFAAAPETPDLTRQELDRVADLVDHNFYLEPSRAGASA